MLKLSKKSEYALMVVQHLGHPSRDTPTPAAVFAEQYNLPPTLLAKVMQSLKRNGVLRSSKGVAGGYWLARPLSEIDFIDVIRPFEQVIGLAACVESHAGPCDLLGCCTIRDPISKLNNFMMQQLEQLSMADFITLETAHIQGRIGQPMRGIKTNNVSLSLPH